MLEKKCRKHHVCAYVLFTFLRKQNEFYWHFSEIISFVLILHVNCATTDDCVLGKRVLTYLENWGKFMPPSRSKMIAPLFALLPPPINNDRSLTWRNNPVSAINPITVWICQSRHSAIIKIMVTFFIGSLRQKRVLKQYPWGTIAINGTVFSKGHSFFLNNAPEQKGTFFTLRSQGVLFQYPSVGGVPKQYP